MNKREAARTVPFGGIDLVAGERFGFDESFQGFSPQH
jgi:hypothetical protein